jgi:hypothetical protein
VVEVGSVATEVAVALEVMVAGARAKVAKAHSRAGKRAAALCTSRKLAEGRANGVLSTVSSQPKGTTWKKLHSSS